MGDLEVTPLIRRGDFHKTEKKANIWLSLFVSVLLGLVSGTLYGFGRYSRALKDLLDLSQVEVQRFGVLLDTGNYIGHPLTGYVYDRFGHKTSCLSAGLIVFMAYWSIHLGVNNQHTTPLAIYDIGFFLVGFGSGLGYIAALGSTTKNFELTPHLGRAIGLVAAGYALCSTLVGIAFRAVGLPYFFILWAILVAAVNILGASFIATKEERTSGDSDIEDDENASSVAMTPLHSPNPDHMDIKESSAAKCLQKYVDKNEGNVARASVHIKNKGQSPNLDHIAAKLLQIETLRSWTSWTTLDFWILFISFACITGCGLFLINNISTIVQSIGCQDSFAGNLVFLSSICNCFGRILMGVLADQPRLRKTALFRGASLLMAAGLFASAASGPRSAQILLIITVTLVSLAYGGSWVLIVGILNEWFGNVDFGKDYGLIIMGPGLSGMAFNMASAWMYQQHTADDSGICIGLLCYHGAFVFTGTAAVVGCILLSFVAHR